MCVYCGVDLQLFLSWIFLLVEEKFQSRVSMTWRWMNIWQPMIGLREFSYCRTFGPKTLFFIWSWLPLFETWISLQNNLVQITKQFSKMFHWAGNFCHKYKSNQPDLEIIIKLLTQLKIMSYSKLDHSIVQLIINQPYLFPHSFVDFLVIHLQTNLYLWRVSCVPHTTVNKRGGVSCDLCL